MVSSPILRDLIRLSVSLVEAVFLVYVVLRRTYLFFLLCAFSLVIQTGAVAPTWRQWVGPIWDFLLTVGFLVSVVLWFGAFLASAASPATACEPAITPEMRAQLPEQANSRLLTLNARLNHLLRSEGLRS
jgi:hypothetical protein